MERFESLSDQDTRRFAEKLAEKAAPGDVYTLSGDLGVGKTVFAKGFARGLGVTEPVTSPTFTIVQEYTSGRLPFYHFDVYRISDPDEMEECGFYDYLDRGGVVLIEWAELIEDVLPRPRTEITISKDLAGDDGYRLIEIRRR
ncbi:tRNA (adenosine(37)-N6)-threonylcarbamoyltransferase complex ATPase subunit type 1 TsaE [Candidatus Weimeria sp. HCP3S3_B5]|uniref:tRNA (adenosine(37)-N6)-threonylcarbamoyltransferase complex ATPase subunit type 1 TsaE n=1 Tax=Candidatus Weimeria sp. HCP3S3_B5 TaxID=3438871 RepID=UPI002A924513|nr:tRNA (adenosine(37)-N6)-threonylcarbamoyltransferase complex ATPase subunit type 1 TsaE [Lachnospiraceae bacterium]MDY6351440.1 tRNA (adenosine(37)-N6)-threonylcarbamoyltransferase complex ATPase subunit type 1 TsaE [Lachnospiraceae bacterium]